MARSCGIRVGPRRYELVVLDGSAKKHKIVAFETGEFPQGGEDPLSDAVSTLKAAIKSADVPTDNVAIAIDTGLAAFRTIKLPDLDESKIEQVIKFEVENELPQWSIDDVVVDFLKLESTAGETNLLVTAVPKSDLGREIEVLSRAGVEPLEVELEATAMVNAAMAAELCTVDEAQILVHVGETSTAVVVVDGGRLRSMRAIHIGALSHEPGRPSPEEPPEEPPEDAASEDEEAEGEEDAPYEIDPQELRRLQEQAVSRIRRELGRTLSGARTAHPIEAIYVCGWELPGLVGVDVLETKVYELDVFEKDSGQPMEGAGPLVAAYGVALRLFGAAAIPARLRREELRYTGAFERVEMPLAITALLLVTLLAVFNIFELKQVMLYNSDVDLWRRSSNNYMLGDMRNSVPGYLDPVPEEVQAYIDRIRRENEKPGQDINPEVDSDRTREEQLRYVANILRRKVGELDAELGNSGEITQPQSALEGMTRVLATLAAGGDEFGRVSVRKIDSQYMFARSGGQDTVQIQLDLTFFADSAVMATANSERFANTLRDQNWVIEVEARGSSEIDEGDVTGIFTDGFTVRCDLSVLRLDEEEQA